MKNQSLKDISLYGFSFILFGMILSTILVFMFLNKMEKYNIEFNTYEISHTTLFQFKYYTERLLTSNNLIKEKRLWVKAKQKFKDSIKVLKIEDKEKQNIIFGLVEKQKLATTKH